MAINLTLNLPKNPYLNDTFEGTGETINELMENICDKFPKLKNHLFNESGELHPYLQVFYNENNIKDNPLSTSIKNNDEIFIFCAVKGG